MIPSCPNPSNTNYLQNNGFRISILKAPELNLFIQSASVPGISLDVQEQPNIFATIPIYGNRVNFDGLSVEFLIDEDLTNWLSIFNWIVGMGFPESHQQYIEFTEKYDGPPRLDGVSDVIFQVLNSSNNLIREIRLVDAFPYSLSPIPMTATSDAGYITATAEFRYSHYYFTR